MDCRFLEISLISAQGLKPSSGPLRRLHAFAIAWAHPTSKLRTLPDQSGAENPTWNERFLFKVPTSFLASDSSSAVSVEIYASGGWCLPSPLIGTVRILIGNHHLLDRSPDIPSFAALGVRRPSGRLHGVLNFATTLLTRVSLIAEEALAECPAVAYRELMCESPRLRRRIPPTSPAILGPLKDRNREGPEERSDGGGTMCGLGFQRRSHFCPTDENLQIRLPDD
ncbi:putative C2 domain-containing protein [Dioscorea sansibarensis]